MKFKLKSRFRWPLNAFTFFKIETNQGTDSTHNWLEITLFNFSFSARWRWNKPKEGDRRYKLLSSVGVVGSDPVPLETIMGRTSLPEREIFRNGRWVDDE